MATSESQVLTIGVAGGSASGKSTISQAIVERVGVENIAHLLHDSYYKPLEELEDPDQPDNINFDHPNALDTELLIQHLRALQTWNAVQIPIYDFVKFERLPQMAAVDPRPVILIEGILVLSNPILRDMLDIRIFVDTPADVRFIRRLRRDTAERGRSVDSVINQYMNTVRPMHRAFVEPSKVHADVIIPQGGYNQVAIDLVADRVRSILLGTSSLRSSSGSV
jgi:uridine kinase